MTPSAPEIDRAASMSTLAAWRAPTLVSPLTRARHDQWDTYVRDHVSGSFFHTTSWKNTVERTFGHASLYLVAEREGAIVGVLPLCLIDSRIVGRLLVSVPYAVEGGVCADDAPAAQALLHRAMALAQEHECTVLDLRSEHAQFPELPIHDRYVGFRRELPASRDDVPAWLPRKARAAARNGRRKFCLSIEYGDEHLREIWRLYSISMRRLASLNYPFRFFKTLIEESPGRHWVSLVRWKGAPVAGLVTLCHGHRVLPYFFGAGDGARRCSAANFIYVDCMERAVAHGYREFDFGRSRRANIGSFQFKRLQGFEPRPLQYQTYVPPNRVAQDLSPDNPRFRFARKLWPHLPLCVTRPLGAHLAAHLPG